MEGPAGNSDRTGTIGPGRLVLVIGPSGAGKDTLLRLARADCAGDGDIVFPRRAVTREASVFEDNERVSRAEFRQAVADGAFAVHWDAHGHGYGLRRAIDEDIRAGRTVVVNVSRTVVAPLRRAYAEVLVVSITAPPLVLAGRLAARARDSDGSLKHRLGRTVEETPDADVMIVNVGVAEEHARDLLRAIRGFQPCRS
jgi:ribose 1,5-bisphosphokinase